MTRAAMPDGKKVISIVNAGQALRFYECPLSWIEEETSELIRIVRLTHDTNLLPLAGGWMDQPYFFVEAYQIFDHELAAWREAKAKEHGGQRKTN
jgi:hypothetical protein